jgi:pyocin large subunit-like protein
VNIRHLRWFTPFLALFLLFTACSVPTADEKPQFASEKHLDDHYVKHVIRQKEFGSISKEEYLQRAQELVTSEPGGDILVKRRSNGDRLFYNQRTNEFAVLTENGIIRTFFKPRDGIDYFRRQ